MTNEELRVRRYKKRKKREQEINRRLKCHGNTQNCEFHTKIKSKKVEVKKTKSFWQKLKEFLWRIIK